jgi:rSAM/selenodomain-associated transferase 2
MFISIIIPVYNEADSIADTISAVKELPHIGEVIVVDGQSSDATATIAEDSGAIVQLAAGAKTAQGQVFWFLHADTRPEPGTSAKIVGALADDRNVGGNFQLRFDGVSLASRFMTWLYPKLRMIGLVYGDSAIFVRRDVYERVGGFKPIPLFEDLDLIRRLRREGKMSQVTGFVTTSSRRFEGRSFVLIFARWAGLQVLYWLGVSPYRLSRLYPSIRNLDHKPDGSATKSP